MSLDHLETKRIMDCSKEELEQFIKKRLLRDNPNENLHLRFNFHARDDPEALFNNRKILKHFKDIISWQVKIETYKGCFDYYWQYDWNQEPIHREYNGWGTRGILYDILTKDFPEEYINLDKPFIPPTIHYNESCFEDEVKDYFKYWGWEVERQVPRDDCKNWKHPYTADLILRHPNLPKLGWIGLELKNKDNKVTTTDGLVQVITKYQSYKFSRIDSVVYPWVLIVPNATNDLKVLANSFGVAIFEWDTKIIPSAPHQYFNRLKSDYNTLDFNCSRKCNHGLMIPIESYGFEIQKGYSQRQAKVNTIGEAILNYLEKKVNWWIPIQNKKVKMVGDKK